MNKISYNSVKDKSFKDRKGTRIEVYTLTPDGLKPTIEFSIYGTIISLELFKPKVCADYLVVFILTRAPFRISIKPHLY